jgi:hypothetical protein
VIIMRRPSMAGLGKAFERRPEVDVVRTFYPFEYRGLHEEAPWDIVLIEGWFEMINAFIHEVSSSLTPSLKTKDWHIKCHTWQVRILSPNVTVLFYALDPDFPGTDVLRALDVDAYLTNR